MPPQVQPLQLSLAACLGATVVILLFIGASCVSVFFFGLYILVENPGVTGALTVLVSGASGLASLAMLIAMWRFRASKYLFYSLGFAALPIVIGYVLNILSIIGSFISGGMQLL